MQQTNFMNLFNPFYPKKAKTKVCNKEILGVNSIALLIISICVSWFTSSNAQIYSPVPLQPGSFNFDAVAETTPATSTSSTMDLSDHAFYAQSYPGNPGGGMPNSLSIASGPKSYDLRPYSGANALYLSGGNTGTMTFVTPVSAINLYVLWMSSEGNSLVSASANFTDGSTQTLFTNSLVFDWFFNSPFVKNALGRVSRAAGTFNGLPSEPRLYEIAAAISPGNQSKLIASVKFTKTNQGGNQRAFIFGIARQICLDSDGDGVCDNKDNCPIKFNPDQADGDNDGVGNICDNCKTNFNPDQLDSDSDGLGDKCDNCPTKSNPDQADSDNDGVGNVCDNCPSNANSNQADVDNDGVGDVCDNCPSKANSDQADADNDGVGDVCDNCPSKANSNQADVDNDGVGDVCDNCISNANLDQADSDCDGVGNVCDVCEGGNDKIDNNNDGKPDCKYPPSYNDIIAAWKCGSNKVYICHIPPGNPNNKQTLCVAYSAVQSHITNHGDYLGQCGNASCNGGQLRSNGDISYLTGEVLDDHGHSHDHSSGNTNLSFIILPNVTDGDFRIEFEHEVSNATIQIYNSLGQIVYSHPIIQAVSSIKLNAESFVNNNFGLYMVEVKDQENREVQTLFISR